MKEISYSDFNKLKLAQNNYLFFGEEDYLISESLKKIQKALTTDDLNREVFYAYDSKADNIIDALKTIPFLNDKRLIIVKEINRMDANCAQKMSGYFDNPSESSCLILSYIGNAKKDKSEKRKNLINKCIKSKQCIVVECKKLYEREARIFIADNFKSFGKSIGQDAIDMLIEEHGCDLQNLSKEIEKLSLFAGAEQKSISRRDIETVGGYTKDINIFNLTSLLEEKKLQKSLFVLEKLLEQGEEPIKILSSISSCVRQMLKAKSMLEEGKMTISDISSQIRMHPYYQKIFIENLKKHKLKTLKDAIPRLLNADISAKTGTGDIVAALEKILLFLCS